MARIEEYHIWIPADKASAIRFAIDEAGGEYDFLDSYEEEE